MLVRGLTIHFDEFVILDQSLHLNELVQHKPMIFSSSKKELNGIFIL